MDLVIAGRDTHFQCSASLFSQASGFRTRPFALYMSQQRRHLFITIWSNPPFRGGIDIDFGAPAGLAGLAAPEGLAGFLGALFSSSAVVSSVSSDFDSSGFVPSIAAISAWVTCACSLFSDGVLSDFGFASFAALAFSFSFSAFSLSALADFGSLAEEPPPLPIQVQVSTLALSWCTQAAMGGFEPVSPGIPESP